MNKTLRINMISCGGHYRPTRTKENSNIDSIRLCKTGFLRLDMLTLPFPAYITLSIKAKNPKKKGYQRVKFEYRISVTGGWFYAYTKEYRHVRWGAPITSPEAVNTISSYALKLKEYDIIPLWIKIT